MRPMDEDWRNELPRVRDGDALAGKRFVELHRKDGPNWVSVAYGDLGKELLGDPEVERYVRSKDGSCGCDHCASGLSHDRGGD